MKKLIQVLMIASLGIQTLMPTMVYAVETPEQVSTTSSSSLEEQSSSVDNTKITEEQQNPEAGSSSQESSEVIPQNTDTDLKAEKPATANDKNAPPYEEKVENERKEPVQLDYSIQGPSKKVLAGETVYFKNTFRITGPETIVKDARLEISLEGLKTEIVFFDSSPEALAKLSIGGVIPKYDEDSRRLIYLFERITAGKAYETYIPIGTKNGFIKEHRVKLVGKFYIEGQEAIHEESNGDIIGNNSIAVKKTHISKPLVEGDDIHWKIDITAPKTTGILYFHQNGTIKVTDKLPANLNYVSSKVTYDGQQITGSYDISSRTVTFEFPAPSYLEQEETKSNDNLLEKLSTIEIVTNVPGKFSGTREFSNVAKLSAVAATGDPLDKESNTHTVPVVGSGGTSNKPAGSGAPIHRRATAANTLANETKYLDAEEPLNVYPGDSIRFSSNVNFHSATSATQRIEYINNIYKPDGNKLEFKDIRIGMSRRNKTDNNRGPYVAAELRIPTYEFRLTVNGQVRNYDAFLTDLIKNQGVLDTEEYATITSEMLGLTPTDVITEIKFQAKNLEPITLINSFYHFKVRETATGEIKNRMYTSSAGIDGNNKRVTNSYSSEDPKVWHGPRMLNVANTFGQSVLVDNYIGYKEIERGETVKAGEQFLRATIVTGKNQPAYENPESYLLLPVGTVYDSSRELISPEGRKLSIEVVSDNYNNSGRQMLRLNWAGNVQAGNKVIADVPVTVSDKSPNILVPKIFTYAKNNKLSVTAGGTGSTQLTDNQDLMSVDYPADHSRIENSNEYYVRNKNNLTIEKAIKASDDADFQMFTGGMVNQKAQYRVKISNETGKDFQNIAVLDVLPSIGDLGITDNIQRGSQFEPMLAGPIKIPASWQDAVTVSYSESKNPKRSNILYNKVTPNHGLAEPKDPVDAEDAFWEENPADFTKIHSIRIELKPGYEFANGQDIDIYYDIQLPNQETVEKLNLDFSQEPQNRAAWNSAAVVADGLPVVESLKVGVALNPLPGKLEAEKFVYNREDEDINGKSISVGQTVKYKIVAKNSGAPSTIVNDVKVLDEIPEGLMYKSGTLKVTYPDGRVEPLEDKYVQGQSLKTDSLGSLYGGQELSVSFEVEVAKGAKGDKSNIATVEGTTPPTTPGEPHTPISDDDNNKVSIPVVSIEKFVDGVKSNRAYVGDTITYSIRVKHEEGGEWYGRILDTLSKDVLYVPGSTEIYYKGTTKVEKLSDESVWQDKQFSYNAHLNEENDELFITFEVEILDSALGKKIFNSAILKAPRDDSDTPDVVTPPVTTEVLETPGKLKAEKGVYKADKDINGQKVKVGDTIEYRILVTNTEDPTTIVNNIVVKDLIPEGLRYQKGSLSVTYPDGKTETLSDDSVAGQQLTTKNLGKLRGQESVEVRFEVLVHRTATGEKVNIASAEGTVPSEDPSMPDEPLTPVEDSKEVEIPAEIVLRKTVFGKDGIQHIDATNAYVEDEILYQIEVEHVRGTGQWTGTIQDKLPDYLEYIPGSTKVNSEKTEDTVWDNNFSKLTIPNAVLNERESKLLITFHVRVAEEGLNKEIINFAQATPDDPNIPPVDDHAIVRVKPAPGRLEAEKSVYKNDQDINGQDVLVNDLLEYRITAKNPESANTIVNNVVIKDNIPADLIYEKGSLKVTWPDGTEKALSDEQVTGQELVTENLGSLKGQESLVISFKVKVDKKARGERVNIATVEGTRPPLDPNDPNERPLRPEKPTTKVKVPSEIEAVKTVDGVNSNQARVGDKLVYRIEVGHKENTGEWTGSWQGEIQDILSEHVTYVPSSTKVNGKAMEDEKLFQNAQLTVSDITLNNDAPKVVVEFEVTVNKSGLGQKIVNVGKAISSDPNTPDIETPPVETEILPSPGRLEAVKGAFNQQGEAIDGQGIKVNDVIEYRITAKNPEAAHTIVNNVVIKDSIPADLIYETGSLKVTLPDGTEKFLLDDQVKGQELVTENLGSLKGQESLVISFKVKVAKEASGERVNIATVEGTTPDPNKPGAPDVPVTPEKPITNVKVPSEITGKKFVDEVTNNQRFVGDSLTYRIVYQHIKDTGQWLGTITDTLPANVRYQPETTTVDGKKVEDTVWQGETLRIPDVVLNNEQSKIVVEFKVTIQESALGTTIKNQATAKPTENPNYPNQPEVPTNEVTTKVVPSPGKLEASKDVFNQAGQAIVGKEISVNDVIEYRITAKNVEAAHTIVNNVVIKDSIPADLMYEAGSLKVTLPDGTEKALPDDQVKGQELVTENLGSLKGQESLVISFKVKVAKEASGQRVNIATVEGTTPDPNKPGEPNVPVTPEKPTTKITVPSQIIGEKFVDDVHANQKNVGDKLTYRLVYKHVKDTGQWEGVIKDTLPANVRYQAGSTKVDGKEVADTVWNKQELTIPNVSLNNEKDEVVVTFEVVLEASAVDTTIKNQATAKPTDNPNYPNQPEVPTNEVTTKVVPSPGKLEAAKEVFNQEGQSINGRNVTVGSVIEYRITAKNPEARHTIVNNVVVKDSIPTDLLYEKGSLKVTLPDGTEKALGDKQVQGQELVTEKLGSLRGQESLVVSFKVKVGKAANGERINIATVVGTTPTGDPDRSTEETPLEPEKPSTKVKVPSEVTVKKTVNATNKNRANIGDTLTYEIEVAHKENTGRWEGTWSGKVEDMLSEHVTYQPNSIKVDGQAVADEDVWNGGKVVIPNVKLDNGKPKLVITFKVTINESALNQTIVNIAKGISDDPNDPEIESPPVTTDVIPSPGKLEASKFVLNQAQAAIDGQTITVGDVIQYQIKVKNTEAPYSIVNNIVVKDAIPADLTYQAGSLKVKLPNGAEKRLGDSQVKGQQLTTENLGSLKGQEELVVSFDVKVDKQARGERINIATVEGTTPDPNEPGAPDQPLEPKHPETNVFVQEAGKITAEKFVRNGQEKDTQSNQAKIGDVLTYTLRFTHVPGTGEWEGAIYDTLPAHVRYVKGSTKINGKEYQDNVWSNNQLGIGEVKINQDNPEYIVTFNVTVGKTAETQIENIAEAVSNNTPNEPILTNEVITKIVKENKKKIVKTNKQNIQSPKAPQMTKRPIAKKALPKTGSQSDILLMSVGMILLISAGSIYFVTRRKDNEKNRHTTPR
ncbi:isopeptide-forming domain-containing fimbrial protein [Enterococcus sp. DIV1444a]|uniref:isopeptide-forming domain-containing fimbrial protein n=1 Tax=Enterococcus sp. DIV1444a TaxID=2774679 RepID=UPI003F28FC5C